MVLRTLGIIVKQTQLAGVRLIHHSCTNPVSFRKIFPRFRMSKIIEPPFEHITQIGDPVLRRKSELVPEKFVKGDEVSFVIEQMVKVLRSYDLVGVAAPQIGVGLRIVAIEFTEAKKDRFPPAVYEARKMSTLPLTVVINPTLKVLNYSKVKFPEGCASVKGFSADVERYEEVNLTGLSRAGEPLSVDLKGWNARIAQHEMDHLDGRIYTDIMDASTFNCTCWEAVNTHGGRVELRFHP